MKKRKYNRETESYCYGRWLKAKGSRIYELFWINMHLKFGELKGIK